MPDQHRKPEPKRHGATGNDERTEAGVRRRLVRLLLPVAVLFLAIGASACGDDTDEGNAVDPAAVEPSVSVRDSAMTVTVYELDDVTVHALTAPEEVFANSTYVIELANSLVAIDTQFLLPNAADMRAYADDLGKPIDRVYITHEHPDHFLGSEAFDDLPVFSLAETSELIAQIGDAEVEEKQGDFGTEAIASSYVIPEVVEPGSVEIDGVTFELIHVRDAETEDQLVIRMPDYGVVFTGDVVYSGVHLIMAGQPDTWIVALEELAATADAYPIVLPGHGMPTDPAVYETNIAWLNTFMELTATATDGEAFKQGLVDTYPDLGMEAAIDFVLPFLYPEG